MQTKKKPFPLYRGHKTTKLPADRTLPVAHDRTLADLRIEVGVRTHTFRIRCRWTWAITLLLRKFYLGKKNLLSTFGWILLVPCWYERCEEKSLLLLGMYYIFRHRPALILPAILISYRGCTSHFVNERVGRSTKKALRKYKLWPCRVYCTVSRFTTYNLTAYLSTLYKLSNRYYDAA